MSLAILVPLVVVGVSLVVLAIHFSGLSRPARIGSDEEVRARYAYDYPLDTVQSMDVTTDRRAAFLAVEGGVLGIVESFGDGYVTERLAPGADIDIATDGAAIRVRSGDVTWLGGTYSFDTVEQANRIAAIMAGGAVQTEKEAV